MRKTDLQANLHMLLLLLPSGLLQQSRALLGLHHELRAYNLSFRWLNSKWQQNTTKTIYILLSNCISCSRTTVFLCLSEYHLCVGSSAVFCRTVEKNMKPALIDSSTLYSYRSLGIVYEYSNMSYSRGLYLFQKLSFFINTDI